MPFIFESGPEGAKIVCRVREEAGIVTLTLSTPSSAVTLALAPEEAGRIADALTERARIALEDPLYKQPGEG